MKQYVLAVVCAALISGILLSMVRGEGPVRVMKLLCGAFLALTLVRPLARRDLGRELEGWFSDLPDGTAIAAEGENMARQARADIIKEQCRAYIMDKAPPLPGPLEVEILLSGEDPMVPVGAVLGGEVSEKAKAELERILQEDLGIPKENVTWTG